MNKNKKFILWFKDLTIKDVPLVGGKNASLGEMYRNLTKKGINVSDGFAVTAYAYRYLLDKAKIKNRIRKILKFALNEINMPISYFNVHKLCQQVKLSYIPKLDNLINLIKENGYKASRTHFDFLSIKTNMRIDDLKSLLIKIEK